MTETTPGLDAYAARCVARKLHPSTAGKLRKLAMQGTAYMEVQPSSPLRKHGFVEPMGGGLIRITDLGKLAAEGLTQ